MKSFFCFCLFVSFLENCLYLPDVCVHGDAGGGGDVYEIYMYRIATEVHDICYLSALQRSLYM